MARFDSKTAVITGGASGIGAETARRIVAEGGTVLISDLQEDRGSELATELGDRASFQRLDVTDEAAWETLAQVVSQRLGPLDVLVNGAGISGWGTIESTEVATWERTLQVNLLGSFLGCRYATRAMRDKGGAIVNLSSCMGVKVDTNQLAYSVSKAALLHLSRNVAVYCGRQGYKVRCNSVLPGAIDTPMMAEVTAMLGSREALEQRMSASHPIGRMGQPAEVAAVIAFLASDESSFVTGAAYAVDGAIIYG